MGNRKNIRERYQPCNFSAHRCHVIEIIITETGVTKIEARLPSYIKTLKGVYVTSKISGTEKLLGYISLFFNEGALKSLKLSVLNSKVIQHNSHPLPLNEEIKQGSSVQGYYLDMVNHDFPYSIKIYLHYI